MAKQIQELKKLDVSHKRLRLNLMLSDFFL